MNNIDIDYFLDLYDHQGKKLKPIFNMLWD